MTPKPVRINLEQRTKQDFVADIQLCFPVIDEVHLDKFYQQMSQLYRIVILDLNSGELLMGLTYNAGWIVCQPYLKNVPTPDKVGEVGEDEEQQQTTATGDPRGFKVDESVLDRLIGKIETHGYENLSAREQDYLRKTSKNYRDEK